MHLHQNSKERFEMHILFETSVGELLEMIIVFDEIIIDENCIVEE